MRPVDAGICLAKLKPETRRPNSESVHSIATLGAALPTKQLASGLSYREDSTPGFAIGLFGFRISDLFRFSVFGFRISPAKPMATQYAGAPALRIYPPPVRPNAPTSPGCKEC